MVRSGSVEARWLVTKEDHGIDRHRQLPDLRVYQSGGCSAVFIFVGLCVFVLWRLFVVDLAHSLSHSCSFNLYRSSCSSIAGASSSDSWETTLL